MNKLICALLFLLLLFFVMPMRSVSGDTDNIDTPVDAEYTIIVDAHAMEPTPTATPVIETCPITYAEVVMLAQAMHEESQVVYWNGTKYGVSYVARQAGVGWCALNRYDEGSFGETLAEVLSKPNQFAWHEDAPVTEHFLWLAQDVVDRWWREKQGEVNVGRTIPSDYLFFTGDGRENWFRQEFESDTYWDWSCPDPYLEGVE